MARRRRGTSEPASATWTATVILTCGAIRDQEGTCTRCPTLRNPLRMPSATANDSVDIGRGSPQRLSAWKLDTPRTVARGQPLQAQGRASKYGLRPWREKARRVGIRSRSVYRSPEAVRWVSGPDEVRSVKVLQSRTVPRLSSRLCSGARLPVLQDGREGRLVPANRRDHFC